MNNVNLTASEIGMLWTQYIQNSMSIQILRYFYQTAEDGDIKSVVKEALRIAEYVTEDVKAIFRDEQLPIPNGFNENDVNLDAPKLFLDPFMLTFIENMGKAGSAAHGLSLGISSRKDIREFFSKTSIDTIQLFNMCVDVALEKGLFVRSPQIDVQNEVEYIEGKKYLSPFYKRVLNTVEIVHLFENIKTNIVGEMICTAFAQTTTSKEIKAYMKRGKEISAKHVKVFSDIFRESAINPPMGSNGFVTDNSSSVFSDRLMMFLMSVLSATGQGNYSTASTASMRFDLAITYQRLSAEIALYAKDGIDILIKHKWLEEPPQALDREEIVKKTKK
ncbi:hypothetical protein GCM10008967_20770 [Bacillus carboniphilus]|uniref:DUF3231 family protein n=1 Tax=Bacillus carboniphilus TaxID=86663 RepID=A0ABN0W9U8_9BACI